MLSQQSGEEEEEVKDYNRREHCRGTMTSCSRGVGGGNLCRKLLPHHFSYHLTRRVVVVVSLIIILLAGVVVVFTRPKTVRSSSFFGVMCCLSLISYKGPTEWRWL